MEAMRGECHLHQVRRAGRGTPAEANKAPVERRQPCQGKRGEGELRSCKEANCSERMAAEGKNGEMGSRKGVDRRKEAHRAT